MKAKLIHIVVFLFITYLFTLINNQSYFLNISLTSGIMTAIYLVRLISYSGIYDSIYYTFGRFNNYFTKDEERKKRYSSYEVYKERILEERERPTFFFLIFYSVIFMTSQMIDYYM